MSRAPLPELAGDFYTRRFESGSDPNTMVINMGPQHPSTHGVLRIVCELDGEYILRAEPVLGYIHRMHEKMGESKPLNMFWPNMGRVDYLHAMGWNHSFALAAERLGEVEVPERAEVLRVIATELNRISSHLLWWGAYLLDLGAFTPIMYAFADREIIMDLLQVPTGSRLTYCYFRFGGVSSDVDDAFTGKLLNYVKYQRGRFPMYRDLVTDNIILRGRCEGIGTIGQDLIAKYGATGPVARGSNIAYDCRRHEPYSIYDRFDFAIPTRTEADAMARYFVRMAEMEQSLRILEQAAAMLPKAAGGRLNPKAPKPNWKLPAGEVYAATEGARGKIGIYLASDGGKTPYRIKLRAPGFSNLSLFAELAQGALLADAVSILGSLDLVIPEIDR